MRIRRAALAAALTALALALPATAGQNSPELVLSPCRLDGVNAESRCGTLTVPEDRAHPEGRKIALRVAVIPALARTPEPDPLFLLAGGPGQAATKVMGTLVSSAFEKVHRTRDLVLVDQRGTGQSNPLECEPDPGASLKERLLSHTDAKALAKCRAGWNADLRFYGTSIAMQDLDEVRAALGYSQIDLWGGSYGTRAALVYLREHAEHVRAVVLDGVAPLTMILPLYFARDGQRALDLLFAHCEKDPGCAKAFPRLRERFAELLAHLVEKPAQALVQDPVTGAPEQVEIDHAAFTGVLRAVLYLPDLAVLVPLTLDRATRGDFAPFVAEATAFDDFQHTMAAGDLFAVLCGEDVPLITEADLVAQTRGTFLGTAWLRDIVEVCRDWPGAKPAPGFHDPVRSDKPVLLLSGELDPVTPPSWAAEAARTLPNSLQITVPGTGHGASSQACLPELIGQFLARGSVKGLDASCAETMKPPPFFLTFAGPSP